MGQLCFALLYPISVSLIFYIPLPPSLRNAAKTRFVYLDLGVVSKSAAAGEPRACSTNSYAPFSPYTIPFLTNIPTTVLAKRRHHKKEIIWEFYPKQGGGLRIYKTFFLLCGPIERVKVPK